MTTQKTEKKKKKGGFLRFLGNLLIVLMTSFLFGVGSILAAGFVLPHYYESNVQIQIQKSDGQGLGENALEELVLEDKILESIIEDNKLTISAEQLRKRVSIERLEGNIYDIHVITNDPYAARALADAVRRKADIVAEDALGAAKAKTVKAAEVPTTMLFPDYRLVGIVGLIAGAVLSIFLLAAFGPKERVIIRVQDVEDYLDLKCLGEIPVSRNFR